ncbi:MAG: radical SAM protein [Pseudomonadota bacterium]
MEISYMMKTLLIYPYFIEQRVHDEDVGTVPMGLYYIGAMLRENGYPVEILNFCHYTKSSPEIPEILKRENPDIIGFSILNGNRWGAIETAAIARQLNPSVKIVFGGAGAAFLWQHLMTHFPAIDYVVIGEGEYTFLHLLSCIRDQKPDHIPRIPGLVFRDGDTVRFTGAAPFIQDLDTLPLPAKHFAYQHLSLSRGCPGNCSFCGSPRIWERKVRFHSAAYFVDQIELLVQKGITFFYVSDDTFTLDKKRVMEICRLILERNLVISWAAISHVHYVDAEMLYRMRLAGCSRISYGVESGSEKIRKRLNKNIRTAQIEKAFHETLSFGILARAYIIYGCPGETWETIQETIDLMNRIKPLSVIFYILDLFPGTALYSEFQKKFHIQDDIWLNYMEDILYFENDPGLNRDLILAFGQKLRTAFHASLHQYAEALELVDRKELYEKHSDFYARLGMTFSHGDYSRIEAVPDKQNIAETMFRRALRYAPNPYAYLGLGVIQQQKNEILQSIKTLEEGLACYPGSEPLHTCLGISYMNNGQYEKALSLFEKFPESEQAGECSSECYRALGKANPASE